MADKPEAHPSGSHSTAQGACDERLVPMRNNILASTDLFSRGREIFIAHEGENYRLRLTSQNKLILTK